MTLDHLYRDVENLKRQYKGLAGGPQLALSSIENGAIDSMDADGKLKMTIGQQDDGGNTINVLSGPTPPTPSGFTVDVDHGKFILHWFGDFTTGGVAPSDWSRAEVHASRDPFFVPSRATARGSIVSAAGGEVTIGVLKGPWTIKMVVWSQAGKMSLPSQPVDVEVPGYGDIVLEEIDAAQTRIDNARAILIDGQETLGTKLDESETALTSLRGSLDNLDETTLPALRQDLDAAEGRLDSAEGQITDAFGQIDAVPGQIATARQEAIDTALAEIDSVEGGLASSIDKKVNWSLDDPPVVFDGPADATWFRVSSFGSGGQVVSQWRWNGTVWVSTILSSAVLAKIDIGAGTFGSLDGVRLKAGSVQADRVAVGLAGNLLPDPLFTNPAVSALREQGRWEWTSHGGETCFESVMPSSLAQADFQLRDPQGNTGYIPISPNISQVLELDVEGPVTTFMYFVYEDGSNNTPGESIQDDLDPHRRVARFVIDPMLHTSAAGAIPVRMSAYVRQRNRFGSAPSGTVTRVYSARFSPMVGGTLIEPGGIQTPHLAADVLEVGNLKAGTAAIAEAVVQKIAASTASIQTADIKNLFVTGTASLSDVVAERIAAETAEFIELEVGNLVAGTGTMDEATIQKLFTDVVMAGMVAASEFIGENAILTGAVTAPKITASEELWAKLAQFVTVYAEMVDSDVFNGRVFRGSTFLTTNDSRWSDAGLFLNDADGKPRFQAPTDGSDFTVNAEMIAKSLTATGRASFLSENNRLEPGAGLVLAAGVGDPPSPPVVSTYYPTIKAPLQDTDRGAYGLAWAGGHFWRWVENEASDWSTAGSNRGRLEKISTGGDVVASFDTGDFLARNGAVGIGTELFLLGPKTGDNDRRWVQVYGTDGVLKRQWEYAEYGSGTYQPGIGRDEEGKLLIAQCGGTGYYRHRVYLTTGALLSVFDGNDRTNSDLNGIYVGAADFGTRRIVVSKSSGTGRFRQFPVFNTVNGDYVGNQSWYSPGQEEARGLVWDGAKFHSIDTAGVIAEFSTLSTGGDGLTSDWWAVYRWAKDVDADLTIDLSSRISPPARFSWPRRARLRITAPNLPQGAGEIAPSLAYKTTKPTRSEFHSPSWWSNTGEPTAYYYELPTNWQSASAPGDGNNFPDGEPSVLSATSGLFEVKGDGSGRWGPLTFNPDGTMSSNAVPAWVPITTFEAGFAPQSWGDVPGYRIWPDGKVEWRGVIAGTLTAGGGRSVLTIPAKARPGRPKNKTGTSNSATSNIRVEFGPTSDPTKLYVYPYGENRSWVSIDELFYYLQ